MIEKKGLYQNKVNSSLIFTCNCNIDYLNLDWSVPFMTMSKHRFQEMFGIIENILCPVNSHINLQGDP